VKASTTCFDPARDTLSIEAIPMFQQGDTSQWTKHLPKLYPARMSEIKQVEIADVHTSSRVPSWGPHVSNTYSRCFLRRVRKVDKAQGCLRSFQNLKEIYVVPRRLPDTWPAAQINHLRNWYYHRSQFVFTAEEKERCKQEVRKFYIFLTLARFPSLET
jgi:hypothetical protein